MVKYKLTDKELVIREYDFAAEVEDNWIIMPDMEHLDREFIDAVNDICESIAYKHGLSIVF